MVVWWIDREFEAVLSLLPAVALLPSIKTEEFVRIDNRMITGCSIVGDSGFRLFTGFRVRSNCGITAGVITTASGCTIVAASFGTSCGMISSSG